MKEYLLNLNFFYCIVIPSEKKCIILNKEEAEGGILQSFLNGKKLDYSNYQTTWFPYYEGETWSSFIEVGLGKTYRVGADLGEEEFINRHVQKKYADGILIAIKDSSINKVNIFKKNIPTKLREKVVKL